ERTRSRRPGHRARPHPLDLPASGERAPGVVRPRLAPHRAGQRRRGAHDAVLQRAARVPAHRDDRQPGLPRLDALLLRHRPRQPAGVLRLPRPGQRAVRRGAGRAAPHRHLRRARALGAPARQARRRGRAVRPPQRDLAVLLGARRRAPRADLRPARRDVRRQGPL
ncbi:MAG: FIG00997352: hypothetical protein, partial [uncultured Frankineae bacterium]